LSAMLWVRLAKLFGQHDYAHWLLVRSIRTARGSRTKSSRFSAS
jgi:hypothetical protein